MAKIANVNLTDTFNTWRVRSNQLFSRVNQFAITESTLYANNIVANVSLTIADLNAVQFTDSPTAGQFLTVDATGNLVQQAISLTFPSITGTIANNQFRSGEYDVSANMTFDTVTSKRKWSYARTSVSMAVNQGYFANIGGSKTGYAAQALTATLPASAALGDSIRIVVLGDAANNPVTVSRNGHRIMGENANLQISTSNAAFGLVYSGANAGWRLEEV
jgi:hypothetical protein